MRKIFLSFFLLCVGLILPVQAYSCIYSGPATPYDVYHHWPYYIVHYNEPLGYGCNSGYQGSGNYNDNGFQMTTRGNYGECHHMRYLDGWWYDYDTGVGFPARNVCNPSQICE